MKEIASFSSWWHLCTGKPADNALQTSAPLTGSERAVYRLDGGQLERVAPAHQVQRCTGWLGKDTLTCKTCGHGPADIAAGMHP